MNSKIVIMTDREISGKEINLLSENYENIVWIDLFGAHKIKRNIIVKKPHDYLSKELYDQIDERATYFAQNWTKIAEKNFSEYHQGIFLSELIEHDTLLFYIRVLKNTELFQRIVLKESPGEIVLISEDEVLKNILLLLSEKLNIKVRIISRLLFRIKNNARGYFRYLIERYKIDIKKVLFFLVRIKNLKLKNIILSKSSLEKPTFLVINHRVIQPVVEKLLSEEKANIIFLNTNINIFSQYIKEDYPVSMFFEFRIKKDIKKIIEKNQKEFIKVWDRLGNNKDFKSKFVFNNTFFWRIIKKKLEYFWIKRFKWSIKNIEILKEIMREKNVNLILVWDDSLEFNRTLVIVGKDLEIPSIMVQHGIWGTELTIAEKIYVDKIALWGERSKKGLIGRGINPSRLTITGNPGYDKIIPIRNNQRIYKDNFIVFATQMTEDYTSIDMNKDEEIINVLYSAIKKIPDSRLIIKVHPGEKIKKYQRLIKNKKYQNVEVIKKTDLFELLNKSSILTTYASTVALEAIILNKPVIIVNLTGQPYQYPYIKSGAAIGVCKEEDLCPAIIDVLNNPDVQNRLAEKREKFILDNVYKLDGKATLRVINLIEETLNKF